ncbi:hypothetical protein [uncultured Polaribacter sp.]|uniref:hypothetical protein n=1 Tax=uncultured Polaribacter sp. TaxID=174711 RepID=UPI0026019DFC|nr:hypothetical protein [uncultured Polaribacter sp.]
MIEDLANELHKGFNATGEEMHQHELDIEMSTIEDHLEKDSAFINRDCTVLHSNGVYEKPNVVITGGRVSVSLGRNVKKIQLRSVPGNGIRHFRGGTHNIPNGEYVLSLFGGTYPYSFIKACISYN